MASMMTDCSQRQAYCSPLVLLSESVCLEQSDCARVQMANASLPIARKYPLFLSAEDIKGLDGLSTYVKEESGYAEIQKTKPDTLGYALNDSPAGEQPFPRHQHISSRSTLDALFQGVKA